MFKLVCTWTLKSYIASLQTSVLTARQTMRTRTLLTAGLGGALRTAVGCEDEIVCVCARARARACVCVRAPSSWLCSFYLWSSLCLYNINSSFLVIKLSLRRKKTKVREMIDINYLSIIYYFYNFFSCNAQLPYQCLLTNG